jgi:hypothetical protein
MRTRRYLFVFSFLTLLLVGFERVGAQEAICPYSLTLPKRQFTRHEPILLKLAITNSSTEPLPVWLGYDREGGFVFTVKRPDGSVIELPRKQLRQGISRVEKFPVEAQQTYTQQLILNEWYDFADPGVYEVAASLATEDAGAEKVCFDKRFTLEITPLDTVQFQQACSELVETITGSRNNAGNAMDAARALLAVKNPLVVPFLEAALKGNDMVDWIIINGLEQVGNEQAINILIPMLQHPNREGNQFLLSRSALMRIQTRTTDPATLELIKTALATVTN